MATTHVAPQRERSFYRKLLQHSRTLHTYLSMLAVVLFLFFGVTGFMLNHAEWFGLDTTQTTTRDLPLNAGLISGKDKLALVEFLRAQGPVAGAVQPFEFPGEGEAFHLAFKSPRSQTDVDIDVSTSVASISTETRGVMGLLTRLHTARDAGLPWQLLLDATSILLVVASITGIVLWQSLPKRRALGFVALGVSAIAMVGVYVALVP